MKRIKLSQFLLIPLILLSNLTLAAQSVDKQIEVESDLKLNIKVLRGEVNIQSWDKQAISVKGTLDELSEGFLFEKQGQSVTIEDQMPRQFRGNDKDGSSLTIIVPRNLTLYAEGVSSSYQLASLAGDIRVNSVSGDIRANDISEQVLFHTVSGDIVSSRLNGKTRLETVSGSIEDEQSDGEISYKSVSGNLEADSMATKVSIEQVSGDGAIRLQQLKSLDVKSISGDIALSIKGLTSMANLDSVSGDISIKLPKTIDARFNLNGGPGGKIHNNFSEDKPKKEKYSPTSFLKFQSGEPKADIKISTISGDIELKRG
ncbi:DUF4097 family beta strand repeat-containing protein [Shewanella sp. UCD-KL12]|uniref:DUF4097 family beta strand repeat-containing protein n=1 Tax=Shewanella sp. UCD-KL12 TaxID=1917163 RepID=UPI0009711196|nr:DUF4097 family beta strand repeat-containing protein [Shewanella sp. UCD-KL12]